MIHGRNRDGRWVLGATAPRRSGPRVGIAPHRATSPQRERPAKSPRRRKQPPTRPLARKRNGAGGEGGGVLGKPERQRRAHRIHPPRRRGSRSARLFVRGARLGRLAPVVVPSCPEKVRLWGLEPQTYGLKAEIGPRRNFVPIAVSPYDSVLSVPAFLTQEADKTLEKPPLRLSDNRPLATVALRIIPLADRRP